jgi:NADH-quinone oxidoreductase subunit N
MRSVAQVVAAGGVPAPQEFVAPDVDWVAMWPVTAVLAAAVLGVLVEAFVPRAARRGAQLVLALAGLLVAGVGVVVLWRSVTQTGRSRAAVSYPETFGSTSMLLDEVSLFLQGSLVVMSVLAVLTMAERVSGRLEAFAPQASAVPGSAYEKQAYAAGLSQTEVFPLTMFAVGGMMVFTASADLLTMFVALEVFSLPLYILCGLARRRRLLSQEASLKYFLLGAFSSAIFLFGIAFMYGITGTVSLVGMGQQLTALTQGQADLAGLAQQLPIVVVAVVMVLVGLLFKVGAVPFHAWTPDVYTGAPTAVTGFMAACTKLAAFGALVRVLYQGVAPLQEMWQPVVWVVAAATMVFGAVVVILQDDIKRILAYSSIAHAGFILTGFAALGSSGIAGILFYVLAYGLSTVAAFGIVALVREHEADGSISGEATHLSQWAGLGRRSPVVAGAFSLLMLAYAGIPLTSGFTAKFGVFSAAVETGHTWLAIVGVVASAVTAFVYVRVIVLMYFTEPEPGSVRGTVLGVGPLVAVAVALGVAATLVLGVLPSPFLDLAGAVAVAGP